ncbi:MAG: 4Fe-4S dicluster domain-containing protein [Chloroflexota bacterium]
MSLKKADQAALNSWVNRLIAKHRVLGVKEKADRFIFGPLSSASELRLDYDVTILPPKQYFLPPREELLKFGQTGDHQPVFDDTPFVLLGVHPYDMVAISQMDAIFSKDNHDSHYMTRRKGATIVACDVQKPSSNVFAGCMGTATVQEGFDVLLTYVDDGYVVDARTAKGEELVSELGDVPAADPDSLRRRDEIWKAAPQLLRKHELKCAPDDLPALLEKSYRHPIWRERATLCHSCGSCNLVCPTCYCFDVRDEINWDMQSGVRSRQWDGCMLRDFAVVAGGHNFREQKDQRFRHRYYRKGKYLWDRMGQIACVGCGRCVTACTTKIANPVEVYNALLEDK